MSFKYVQLAIGTLLTDEEVRLRFLRAPRETLLELTERCWELTEGEIEALLATDPHLWSAVAAKLPSRLQRCSLRSHEDASQD
ncbi:MAG: hypothetical protein ABI639_08965 [Thermoanaerobaculia bacterium]